MVTLYSSYHKNDWNFHRFAAVSTVSLFEWIIISQTDADEENEETERQQDIAEEDEQEEEKEEEEREEGYEDDYEEYDDEKGEDSVPETVYDRKWLRVVTDSCT